MYKFFFCKRSVRTTCSSHGGKGEEKREMEGGGRWEGGEGLFCKRSLGTTCSSHGGKERREMEGGGRREGGEGWRGGGEKMKEI